MKTKSLILLLVGLIILGCELNNQPNNAAMEKNYPVDLPLILRSSSSSSCSPNLVGDTIYVFNAQEEITGDLACLDVQNVDWNKNSFLAVKIQRFNADSRITKSSLQEVSAGQYQLKVEITPSATQNAAPLYFYMTVSKISREANIALSVSVPEEWNAGTFQLKDTYWKLAGYVDVSTGKSIDKSITVDLGKKPFLSVGTEVYDSNIGNIGSFYEAIKTINFHLVDSEGLKFFYNDRKNYLLYKKIEGASDDSGINNSIYSEGYIVNYDYCGGLEMEEKTAKANGYFIISENLKDTLLTYNLPDNLFEFPLAFFGRESSEHSYRYDYKIGFTYRIAKESERIYTLCPAMYPRKYSNARQIIIDSASNL